MWEWLWNRTVGGNWKSCKDFEESVSKKLKCLGYTAHIILDFEDTVTEDLNEIEENLIRGAPVWLSC